MKMAEDGVDSQIGVQIDNTELWSVTMYIHGEETECFTLYIWSLRFLNDRNNIENERKLSELYSRFVKKALAVVEDIA